MKQDNELDELAFKISCFGFSLKLEAGLELSDWGGGNYRVPYKGHIYNSYGELDVSTHEAVGEIRFSLLHVGHAQKQGIDTPEFCDDCNCVEIENIFEPNEVYLTPIFRNLLPTNHLHPDILVIRQLEILPDYRGMGLGEKMLKLLLFHFKYSCGMLIFTVEPSQFASVSRRFDCGPVEPLALNAFTDDEELAYLKLKNYFSKMGFQEAVGINSNLMFICTEDREVHPREFGVD